MCQGLFYFIVSPSRGFLHLMSSVSLCSCVSYTVCQGLVCVRVSLTLCVKVFSRVLVSLTLSVKVWSVLLFILHCVSSFGLCSCVSYTVCQGLVCIIVSPTLCVKVCSIS